MVTSLDKNTALVLIDLQNNITQRKLVTPKDEILANVAKLIEAFRKADLPVVVVNVNPAGANWVKARKDEKAAQNQNFDENALKIVPELKTQPDDIFITKKTWNAFYDTTLDEELQKRNVTGIVLAGVATSIGVEGTARAASERGYNITFAEDAMTDVSATAHEHSLSHIFPRIGETDETSKIIDQLSA